MDTTSLAKAAHRDRVIKSEAWRICQQFGLPFEPRQTGSTMTKGFKPMALLSHIPLDFILRIELRTKYAEGFLKPCAEPLYIIMPPEDIIEDGEDGPLENLFRAGYRSVAGTRDQFTAFSCAQKGWRVEAVYIKVWTLNNGRKDPKPSRLPSKSEVDEIVNYWPTNNQAKLLGWLLPLLDRGILDERFDRDRDLTPCIKSRKMVTLRLSPAKLLGLANRKMVTLRLPPVKLLGSLLCVANRKAGPRFMPRTVGQLYPGREDTSTMPPPAATSFVVPPLGSITYSSSQSVSRQAVLSSPTFQSAAMDVLRSSEALNAFNDALLAGRLNLHHNLVKYIHDRSAKARYL